MASTEENKALVRRWFAEADKGNLAIIDELCAPDYIDHNPPLPNMPEGSDGVRQANIALGSAFPDTVHIIEAQIAEGDLVVTRLRGRGTFTGECLGISIHRIADGKLVEHWANADLLGLLQQMGAIPSLESDTSATH